MLGKDKKRYCIVLDKKVKKEIDKMAKDQERSSSWLINYVLKKYIKSLQKK